MPDKKPKVGRIVHVDLKHPDGPMAAIITRVWSDTCINVSIFKHDGTQLGRTSVVKDQEGEHGWDWPAIT